jgi:hypothetical protein
MATSLCAAISGQDARWPHSQDGCATRESQSDLIGKESRLRNS